MSIALRKQPLAAALAACVIDLSVDQTLDHADHLSLRLAVYDAPNDTASWVDDDTFAAGARLAVQLGYGSALDTVFDGDIVGLGIELHASERPVLTIDAYNMLHRLGRGRPPPAPPQQNSTFGALVTQIAQRYGLTADVQGSDADKQNDSVHQQHESDLQFIGKLAAEIGYEFFVSGERLVFRKQNQNAATALTVAAGDLLEFSGRIDAASQIGIVDGSAFDHDGNQPLQLQRTNPDSTDKAYGEVDVAIAQPLSVDTREQLQARIDAELTRIRDSYFSVTATSFGRTDVSVGMRIGIADIPRRFDGDFLVTNVKHTFSQNAGFRTALTLKGRRR